jgi:hypothetical protein
LADGKGKCADHDTLNTVYSALLKELTLDQRHVEALRKRGLKGDLRRIGYRSLEDKGRAKAVQALIQAGLEKHLPQVPGFFVQEKGTFRYWTVSGPVGLLIPCGIARVASLPFPSGRTSRSPGTNTST